MRSIKKNRTINEMFNQPHFQYFHKVRNAEVLLSAALVECNIPFTFMDTLSPLCAQIFPDSQIAKDIACRRTKTTAIMKESLGQNFQEELFSFLRQPGHFFSLIMDETTDVGTIKQCAFTVIFYCNLKKKVVTRFLDMIEVSSGNANDLFGSLKSCL